jgi:hypothetical protein
MSRLTREDIQQIFKEVEENTKRLLECSPRPHTFVREPDPLRKTMPRYRCTKCNGHIDPIAYKWYLNGLEDGAKS